MPVFPFSMSSSRELLHLGAMPSWMSPECISINRLPMRATLYPFPDARAARTLGRTRSPWFQGLDGAWQFRLAEGPGAVTVIPTRKPSPGLSRTRA